MGITADKILSHRLVDAVIEEPLGGAHRDVNLMMTNLNKLLINEMETLKSQSLDELLDNRYQKFMAMGASE